MNAHLFNNGVRISSSWDDSFFSLFKTDFGYDVYYINPVQILDNIEKSFSVVYDENGDYVYEFKFVNFTLKIIRNRKIPQDFAIFFDDVYVLNIIALIPGGDLFLTHYVRTNCHELFMVKDKAFIMFDRFGFVVSRHNSYTILSTWFNKNNDYTYRGYTFECYNGNIRMVK